MGSAKKPVFMWRELGFHYDSQKRQFAIQKGTHFDSLASVLNCNGDMVALVVRDHIAGSVLFGELCNKGDGSWQVVPVPDGYQAAKRHMEILTELEWL